MHYMSELPAHLFPGMLPNLAPSGPRLYSTMPSCSAIAKKLPRGEMLTCLCCACNGMSDTCSCTPEDTSKQCTLPPHVILNNVKQCVISNLYMCLCRCLAHKCTHALADADRLPCAHPRARTATAPGHPHMCIVMPQNMPILPCATAKSVCMELQRKASHFSNTCSLRNSCPPAIALRLVSLQPIEDCDSGAISRPGHQVPDLPTGQLDALLRYPCVAGVDSQLRLPPRPAQELAMES